jgi:hypothetical protein
MSVMSRSFRLDPGCFDHGPVLAYSGVYTVEGNKITTHVDMSSNEIYTGANQNQTRFFRIEGDKLTLRTPEIVGAVRPGKKPLAP